MQDKLRHKLSWVWCDTSDATTGKACRGRVHREHVWMNDQCHTTRRMYDEQIKLSWLNHINLFVITTSSYIVRVFLGSYGFFLTGLTSYIFEVLRWRDRRRTTTYPWSIGLWFSRLQENVGFSSGIIFYRCGKLYVDSLFCFTPSARLGYTGPFIVQFTHTSLRHFAYVSTVKKNWLPLYNVGQSEEWNVQPYHVCSGPHTRCARLRAAGHATLSTSFAAR